MPVMEVLGKYALDYNMSAVIKICIMYMICNTLWNYQYAGNTEIAQRNESCTNDMMMIQQ